MWDWFRPKVQNALLGQIPPLYKHSLNVFKKKLDLKFHYLGIALHSQVLLHPRLQCSKFQKHKYSSRLAVHSINSHWWEKGLPQLWLYCSDWSGSGVWSTNPCRCIHSQILAVVNWYYLDYSRIISALSEMEFYQF